MTLFFFFRLLFISLASYLLFQITFPKLVKVKRNSYQTTQVLKAINRIAGNNQALQFSSKFLSKLFEKNSIALLLD